MKILIVYFRAGGTTVKVVQEHAEAAGKELFEIVPVRGASEIQRWIG